MSDDITLNLSNAVVLKAVEEYLNRTMFKTPMKLADLFHHEDGGFNFTAEPLIDDEPHTPKAKKEPKVPKRGLAKSVLGEQQVNGGVEQEV